MKLNDYESDDYIKEDVHTIINKHKLVNTLDGDGYYWYGENYIDKKEVNLNYDINIIFVL